MRKFLERAILAIPRMDRSQVESLVEEIRDELNLKEMVLGSMTAGILVSDTEDRIVYTNKAANTLLPMRAGEHAEHLVWTVVNDVMISDFIKHVLTSHETVKNKLFMLESDRGNYILSVSILPLAQKGKIFGNVLLAEDVTEEKHKEVKLRRAESLASLTTMAAGVAHEIKNPLGSMSIHIQLMEKILGKEEVNRDLLKKYLSIVSEEIERLNGIVVDYLFAVRPVDIEPVDTDVNLLLKELLEFTRFELEEAGVYLEFDPSDRLPRVSMDDKYMKPAFLNIIKNAIQAMDEGGLLVVRTLYKDNRIHVIIRDNGCGMTEEVKNKLFEPYFTTKKSGSGLGLTLVYKIVKEHKGEILVDSKEGEGTTFTFIFQEISGSDKLLLEQG